MCRFCWEERGGPTDFSPEVIAAAEKIAALYRVHGAGGALHIVTDDMNVEDDDLEFARKHLSDDVERACYEALLPLTEDQRLAAIAFEEGWYGGAPTEATP